MNHQGNRRLNACACCGTVEGPDGSFAEKGATYALTFKVDKTEDVKTVHKPCGIAARLAFIKESGGQLPANVQILVESWFDKNQKEASRGVSQLVAGSSVIKAAMDAAKAAKAAKSKVMADKMAEAEAVKKAATPPNPAPEPKPPTKEGKGTKAKGGKDKAKAESKPTKKAGKGKPSVAAMVSKGPATNTALGAAMATAAKGAGAK